MTWKVEKMYNFSKKKAFLTVWNFFLSAKIDIFYSFLKKQKMYVCYFKNVKHCVLFYENGLFFKKRIFNSLWWASLGMEFLSDDLMTGRKMPLCLLLS